MYVYLFAKKALRYKRLWPDQKIALKAAQNAAKQMKTAHDSVEAFVGLMRRVTEGPDPIQLQIDHFR